MEVLEKPALSIRAYEKSRDYRMILGWWQMHGGEGSEIELPPMGVIVGDAQGPACALWVAEPVGFSVAYLEFPVSRPGLPPMQARAAFELAVASLMQLAGQCHEPPGQYKRFRAVTPFPLARVLMRMGFVRETTEDLVPMIFTRE